MPFEENRDRLLQVVRSFHTVSKAVVAVYDGTRRLICSYPPHMNAFCAQVREDPLLEHRCFMFDNTGFDVCDKTKKLHLYHYHMGLVEVISPIIENNLIIGYIMFGQMTDAKDRRPLEQIAAECADKHALDRDRLLSNLHTVPYRGKDYIESISMLLEMCAGYLWQSNIMSVKTGTAAYQLSGYLSEHLDGDLSVKTLCRLFGLSRSGLYRIAKEHFGGGVTDYIRNLRIDRACTLLQKRECPVSEVASLVGFDDPNYFTRLFRRRTGRTPNQYRNGS